MGTSHPETKPWVVERILEAEARTVLDVGAGAGNWLDALREHGFAGRVDAVELWAPYIDRYHLRYRYHTVIEADVRRMRAGQFAPYDVVIFGDVLEHMTTEEAVECWSAARTASHAAIAIPIVPYHQGALNGNPHERHVVEDWTDARVRATFPGITAWQTFTVTGAYWR